MSDQRTVCTHYHTSSCAAAVFLSLHLRSEKTAHQLLNIDKFIFQEYLCTVHRLKIYSVNIFYNIPGMWMCIKFGYV